MLLVPTLRYEYKPQLSLPSTLYPKGQRISYAKMSNDHLSKTRIEIAWKVHLFSSCIRRTVQIISITLKDCTKLV